MCITGWNIGGINFFTSMVYLTFLILDLILSLTVLSLLDSLLSHKLYYDIVIKENFHGILGTKIQFLSRAQILEVSIEYLTLLIFSLNKHERQHEFLLISPWYFLLWLVDKTLLWIYVLTLLIEQFTGFNLLALPLL